MAYATTLLAGEVPRVTAVPGVAVLGLPSRLPLLSLVVMLPLPSLLPLCPARQVILPVHLSLRRQQQLREMAVCSSS